MLSEICVVGKHLCLIFMLEVEYNAYLCIFYRSHVTPQLIHLINPVFNRFIFNYQFTLKLRIQPKLTNWGCLKSEKLVVLFCPIKDQGTYCQKWKRAENNR